MIVATIASINTNLETLSNKQVLFILITTLIATLLILGVLYLFYQLIYGFLLKKLHKNYKKLAKLERTN
jgi:hypothetical protein